MEHQFNVELATKLGVEKAVIIHNMYFWINHNAKNNKNVYDSSVWTYNSASAFGKLFPYIKDRTISRYLLELERDGYIKTGNYSDNIFDKTKWYSFTDNFLEELKNLGFDIENILLSQNVHIDMHKMANRTTESGEPIPDSKQEDVKQEEKEEIDKSISKKKAAYNANADVDEFVDRMYALYPAKCPKRGTSLGKSQKDKGRIKSLLKTYSESDIEFVFRWEIEQKYGKTFMLNFSTFLNNFPDPTQIEGYNELNNTSTNTLPNGLTKEQCDTYISKGYEVEMPAQTYTEETDDNIFINGQVYK